jgi:hypothetical protein
MVKGPGEAMPTVAELRSEQWEALRVESRRAVDC